MTEKTLTADDFAHAHFAMHPVTGSVASKGRMDWKWVLPGWYNTGDPSRLSDQEMADAGWSPVRQCPHALVASVDGVDRWRERYDALMDARDRTVDQLVQAERERDVARSYADEMAMAARSRDVVIKAREVERDEARAEVESLRAEPRALTAEAITDEMVKRAQEAIAEKSRGDFTPGEVRTYNILRAALTESEPTRPEGAEHYQALIADQVAGDLSPEAIRALADRIARDGGQG